jgi:hypothetical protein
MGPAASAARADLERLARSDPDKKVREAAGTALAGMQY